MEDSLNQYYRETITPTITNSTDCARFIARLKRGKLAKAENPKSHCCVMILAFDQKTKEVLLIHHKKANSWFFPGGHVERNELPTRTAIREAGEEIGLIINETNLIGPFGAQVLDINNPPQICREHYDVFWGISTNPAAVTVNMEEFYAYEWLPVEKAKERIALKYYKDALDKFIIFMDW